MRRPAAAALGALTVPLPATAAPAHAAPFDDVRVYRRALSPAEPARVAEGAGPDRAGLGLWLPFEGITG